MKIMAPALATDGNENMRVSAPYTRTGTSLGRPLNAFARAWHYEATQGRDLRLDLMRGFAVVVMVTDHGIAGVEPGARSHSWLAHITGADQLFVSAAEFFVLISGLVMGMVYRSTNSRANLRSCVSKALRRAGILYAVTLFAAVLYVIDSHAGVWWARQGSSWPQFLIDVATFRRTANLVDIPMLYTGLLLLAIPILLLLSRGLGGLALLLSWLLWISWQVHPGFIEIPWSIRDNDVFFIESWQVIFCTGLVMGWHRHDAQRLWHRLSVHERTQILIGCITLSAVVYTAQVLLLQRFQYHALTKSLFFDKPDVSIGRIAALGLFATGAYALLTVAWRPVEAIIGWLLLPLGQNAMTAYLCQLIVFVPVSLFLGPTGGLGVTEMEASAIQIAVVLSIWLTVQSLKLYRLSLPSPPFDQMTPAALKHPHRR